MKALVKQTKRNTTIILNGVFYTKNNDWSNHNFTVREKLEGEGEGGLEIEGYDLDNIYQNYLEVLKKDKETRDTGKNEVKTEMEAIINNAENHTPLEIWKAVKWSAKQGHGWGATDILLAKNPLSRHLLNVIGSYTVSAFDDNSIMIKAGNKRYGTLRKWTSLEDIL
jgi:hypothetical protein